MGAADLPRRRQPGRLSAPTRILAQVRRARHQPGPSTTIHAIANPPPDDYATPRPRSRSSLRIADSAQSVDLCISGGCYRRGPLGYCPSVSVAVPGHWRRAWSLTQARRSGAIPMASQIRLTAADGHACAVDVLSARQADPRKFRLRYRWLSALVLWRSNSRYATSKLTAPVQPIVAMSQVTGVPSQRRVPGG